MQKSLLYTSAISLTGLIFLSIPDAMASDYGLAKFGEGLCEGLKLRAKYEIRAGWNEQVRTRGKIPELENPSDKQLVQLAKKFGLDIDRCEPRRLENCLRYYAQNGADGIYSIKRCLKNEAMSMGVESFFVMTSDNQLLEDLRSFSDSFSCIERVWILDRQDFGTALRACRN
jgi:hypothetical protein